MKVVKLIIAGIISYVIVYFLFLTRFATPEKMTSFIFFYKTLLFVFSLFSFLSITFNLYDNLNKNTEERTLPENVWLLGLLLPICIVVTIITSIRINQKRIIEKEAIIKNNQTYNDSMKKIVLNTTLLDPTFYLRNDDSNNELLIKLPVEFSPEALKTSIKALQSNQMGFYYWFSFNQIFGDDIRDTEKLPVVGNCKILNQFIRFQDPKISFVNEISVTQTYPAYFISIYFYGDGCDTEILKGLVGKPVYVYSYVDELNKTKQIVKEYIIKELN